jgi:hypothetical protein
MPGFRGFHLPHVGDLFKSAARGAEQVAPYGFRSFEDAARKTAPTVARSSGSRGIAKRTRRYAIRGGLAAGALGGAYGVGRSSGVQGLTPGASGSGGYPTGMYGA